MRRKTAGPSLERRSFPTDASFEEGAVSASFHQCDTDSLALTLLLQLLSTVCDPGPAYFTSPQSLTGHSGRRNPISLEILR
jgi:hypothetical protein